MPRRPRADPWRRRAGKDLVAEVGVVEPLGTDQQHIHLARGHLLLDGLPLLRVRRVDRAGTDTGTGRRLHLVAHQREERGDDHRGTASGLAQQGRRHEVHRGLAPPGPLHHQRPSLVRDERLDGPPLVRPQSRRAGRVSDETGEYGIGGGSEARAVGETVCVGHPHATRWVGHCANERRNLWTTGDRGPPGVIHRGFGVDVARETVVTMNTNPHESRGSTESQQITLRGPAELADALPFMLGFHPTDSVVLVALHGEHGRFGGRVRLGIPRSAAEWPSTAEHLAECLVEGCARRGTRPDGIVVFLCQDPAPGETGRHVMERLRPFSQRLRTACGELDIPVYEVLCISDGLHFSYVCPDTRCCPPDGTPSP